MSHRDLIWQHRFNLKASSCVLLEDFAPLTQKRRSTLQLFFNAARKHPDVKRCQLNRESLIINGQKYTVDMIETLSFNLSSTNKSQRNLKSSNATAFFGKESFLSNFHESVIAEKQHTFSTVEHYYQYRKAVYFKDHTTANAILSAKTPHQAKALSYKIKDFNDNLWNAVAEHTMLNPVTKKFEQNPILKEKLLATKGQLIEANPKDTYFSCGLSLNDPNIEA